MNKMKKVLMLALSLAMSATLFAACGKDKGDGASSSENSSVESSSPIVDDSSEDVSSSESSSEEESSSESSSESQKPSEVSMIITGKASMMEFESIVLEAVVSGSDDELDISWESSDSSIASVDENGVVTAYKTGSVTITASADGISATHTLTITATSYVHAIEFDINEVKIYDDAYEMVEASVVFKGETLDNDEYDLVYTWEKVSGDDVVVVETDGAVATFTASKPGTAVYKVSTIARGYAIEKTISVTVMENEYSFTIPNEKVSEVEGGYKTSLTLISDATLDIGKIYGVLNGEPMEDELTVEWSTESDVVSIENGVITALKAGEGVITGTTTYGGKSLTISITVVVEKHQATLNKTITIEAVADTTDFSALAEEIKEDIKVVKVGNFEVFNGSAAAGSIALTAKPVKAEDLGKNKVMVIETDTTFYTLNANVYTMIIDNAAELDTWQEVAEQVAVDAGIIIPEQKGFAYSGYFVLGDDIAYNGVWQPLKNYSKLWALCYESDGKGGTREKEALKNIEGAVFEDWGAGKKGGFQGVFDGNGHYIDGMEISGQYNAFIVTLGVNGVIKDLSFTNAKIGAQAGLVANRGQGAFKNIFVEVAEMASGTDKDNPTHVVVRPGNSSVRTYDNIVVDLSRIDFANLDYAMVISCIEDASNGIFVLGAEDALLYRGTEGWVEGSNDTSSWDASQACIFWHYLVGDDAAGSYENVAGIFAEGAYGELVQTWDSEFWLVTENAVIAKGVADLYTAGRLEITNSEFSINAGRSVAITTNKNGAYVSFALKEAVEGVSLAGNVVSVADDVAIGTKFTVVVTSLLNGELVDEVEFTAAPKIVALDYTTVIETTANETIALPENVEGTISKVMLGSVVAYDSANSIGSINGNQLTAGAMPVAMSDLGDSVLMTIETDKAKYEMYVSVYTMIIDTAEELNQWYAKASDNALAAGLVIEAQKDFVLSGYFVLGADIEYNAVWKHIAFGTRWAACYGNINIWKDQSLYKNGSAPAANNMVEGAIVEDWGAGEKGGFRGVFDGKGHTIEGLELKGEYAGFIGTMGIDGVLKNVAFTNVSLGSTTGIVERGGKGGAVENVYIEVDAIESGSEKFTNGEYKGDPTKVMTQHGKTKLTNVIVNVTECDFVGVNYVYLLNLAYNEAENVYIINNNYIAHDKTGFTAEDNSATGFWHFNPNNNDKGASFATTEDLLADADHGAIVANLGGYWKVEDGKLYFGNTRVETAPLKFVDQNEYKLDENNQVTLSNELFTEGSVWAMSIDGVESTVTIEEEGKLTITIDPLTIDGYETSVVLSKDGTSITFAKVITTERYVDETEYKMDANSQVTVNNENFTAGSTWSVYVNEAAAGTVTIAENGKATITIDTTGINGYTASVVLRSGNKAVFVENVFIVHYITTAEQLRAIGMGDNNGDATANLTGYYALGANITFTHKDDKTDVIAAGYHKAGANKSHLYSFKGIFDGNGYTIDNMRVSDGGIFGYVEGATIKNLKLTNVQVLDSVGAVSSQGGAYSAILAYVSVNTTFEDIEISVANYPSKYSWQRIGLLVCDTSQKTTYRNITVDASGLVLKNVLGMKHNAANVYENVSITAWDYAAIGYTADSYDTNTKGENVAARMSEFPAGVTFTKANKMIAQNVQYSNLYSYYADDVTALGFAAGTKVVQAGIVTENGWDDQYATRAKLGTVPAGYDYVDIQFSLNKSAVLTVWDGVNVSYVVSAAGVTASTGNPYDRVVQVLDANGNVVSAQAFTPNTVYTLRMYLADTNGVNYVKNLQLTTTTTGAVVYFGNINFGMAEKSEEDILSGLELITEEDEITVSEEKIGGRLAWKVVNDGASKPRVYIDVEELDCMSTLTFSVYLEEEVDEPFRIRAMVDGASETEKFEDVTFTVGWNEITLDISEWTDMGIEEFAFELRNVEVLYLRNITVE